MITIIKYLRYNNFTHMYLTHLVSCTCVVDPESTLFLASGIQIRNSNPDQGVYKYNEQKK